MRLVRVVPTSRCTSGMSFITRDMCVAHSAARGQAFAIHPLDLTRVQNTTVTINGEKATVTICEAAFEDTKGYRDFDAVLGDSFLKNVYAS